MQSEILQVSRGKCVIRKIVLNDKINEEIKFTKKSLLETLRLKTLGKSSYQARKIAKLLEEIKIIPEGYSKRLEDDKDLRIDNQYYLKNRPVEINNRELSEFILTIKNKINSITLNEINMARDEIKKIIG